MGETKLWKKVIFVKYGMHEKGWKSKVYKRPHGCGFWLGIMSCQAFLESNISFSVDKGDRIMFWEDRWCKNIILKEHFPNLYNVLRAKFASVRDLAELNRNVVSWNLHPRRRLSEVEIGEVLQLLPLLDDIVLTNDPDLRLWG